MSTLANLCKRLRAAKNVGVVAELARVDRSTVRRVRDGKHAPNMATFERLDKALKRLEATA
jgi:predicted transcriptional regulator